MNLNDYEVTCEVNEEYITVQWELAPHAKIVGLNSSISTPDRYPKLTVHFKYRDITKDTLRAMLRDMRLPEAQSKGLLTLVQSYRAKTPA